VEVLFSVLVYKTGSFAVRSVRDAAKGTQEPAGQTNLPNFRLPHFRLIVLVCVVCVVDVFYAVCFVLAGADVSGFRSEGALQTWDLVIGCLHVVVLLVILVLVHTQSWALIRREHHECALVVSPLTLLFMFCWAVVTGVVVLFNQTLGRWAAGLIVVYSSVFMMSVREYIKDRQKGAHSWLSLQIWVALLIGSLLRIVQLSLQAHSAAFSFGCSAHWDCVVVLVVDFLSDWLHIGVKLFVLLFMVGRDVGDLFVSVFDRSVFYRHCWRWS
jgi:hypothetical protein